MDKKNIYELMGQLKNKNFATSKKINLIYNSINVSKNGIINIDTINSEKEFDKLFTEYESDNNNFKFV